MTVNELLSLPTDDLSKLSDKELLELLGPLVPESRRPDKDSIVLSEAQRLAKQGQAIMDMLNKQKQCS